MFSLFSLRLCCRWSAVLSIVSGQFRREREGRDVDSLGKNQPPVVRPLQHKYIRLHLYTHFPKKNSPIISTVNEQFVIKRDCGCVAVMVILVKPIGSCTSRCFAHDGSVRMSRSQFRSVVVRPIRTWARPSGDSPTGNSTNTDDGHSRTGGTISVDKQLFSATIITRIQNIYITDSDGYSYYTSKFYALNKTFSL